MEHDNPALRDNLGDFTASRRLVVISALALPIGALSAVVAALLIQLIGTFTNLFFYQRWSDAFVTPAGHRLGAWAALVPVAGGLIIGLMARYGSDRIRGHGIPEALEAILTRGSRVEPRVAVLKPVSAAISIGSGGPFGAEGPIIMTGGALGSMIAQLFHLTAAERKTLLVAGAAAGMSATFCAPLAAVLLAVELLLFELKPRSFVPVALASATAMLVRVPLLGQGPIFAVPPHSMASSASSLVASAAVGLLMGGLAWLLTKAVYLSEDAFKRLPVHWMWWPAIGGVVVGLLGLVEPRALGVGYDTIGELLRGELAVRAVLVLVLVKASMWALFLGSGTSGGVLAPLLMIGSAVGGLVSPFLPDRGVGFWPLIAMGAVLGGTMRAPLTGVVFALELTDDRSALLSLLCACSVAHAFTVLLLRRSILTEKVARRGYHITREYAIDPLEVLFVRDVMQSTVVGIPAGASSLQAARVLEAAGAGAQSLYPVLDDEALVGVVSSHALASWTRDHPGSTARVDDIAARDLVTAHFDEPLTQVVQRMAHTGRTRLPVLSRGAPQRFLGLVTLEHLLKARQRHSEEEGRRERVLRPELLLPAALRPVAPRKPRLRPPQARTIVSEERSE